MKSRYSRRGVALCGVALSVLVAGLGGASSAWAEVSADAGAAAADDSASYGLSEVVVTAQKRETNLQKTPISISVLSGSDLENRHVQSLVDLVTGGAPGLRITPYASRPFNLILNIRGVGVMIDTNQPARDPGVGVYIDGVYLGRPQGLNAALYDVERIEVLKGPQGTLFGRNTEGGALNITSKKPTGEFHLEAVAGMGSYGAHSSEIHLDLPKYDNFSVKVDGILTARDGVVKNPLAGASDYGAYDRRGVHAQVQWDPVSNFSANYSYDTSHDESSTLYSYVVQPGTNKVAPLTPIQPHRVKSATVGIPLQPSIGTQSGHALTLKWDVSPNLTIKSISSYRELYQNQWQNSPSNVFTPNAQFGRYSLAEFVQDQYSQEFQAIGDIGRIKYVAGALAYHEKVADMAQTFNSMQFNATGTAATVLPLGTNIIPIGIDIPILFPTAAIDRASRVNSDSYGVYGQATWTPPVLNDIVHLTGGLRWTQDKKDGQLYVVNNAVPVDQFGKSAVLGFSKSWSRVDPMINLAVDVTPDVQTYVKWSTGYKSGGANSRSLSYKAFNPEEVSMWELGLKSEFFDHRARFNIAAYTGDYKEVQIDFSAPYYSFDANGNVITSASTTRTTTDTVNIPGKGKVSGVETEFTLVPMEGLTLSASYTYAYVHLASSINPFPTFVPGVGMVVATTPIALYQEYTPKHAVNAAIDYVRPLQNFTVRAHLDGNYDSGSYGTDRDPSPVLKAIKSQAGLVFNGRVSLADIELAGSGAKLSFSLWGRNLFNEEHLYTRSISATSGITGAFNEPRTFGLEFKVRM
jgi:iron complex outermembrane receptor protein